MNYSRAIFLISDDVRAVVCTYEAGDDAPRTVFKTLDQSIKVDDFVVVPSGTRHKMTICKVVEVDVEPDLEGAGDIGWVVGVVSRADFEAITAQEDEAIERIKAAERRRKKAELRETLLKDAEQDLKALPIYTASDGEEVIPPVPVPEAPSATDDMEF